MKLLRRVLGLLVIIALKRENTTINDLACFVSTEVEMQFLIREVLLWKYYCGKISALRLISKRSLKMGY